MYSGNAIRKTYFQKNTCIIGRRSVIIGCTNGILLTWLCFSISVPLCQEIPSVDQAIIALRNAVRFLHSEVSSHGGYVWRYSSDLTLRQGEGKASETMIWIQPPGTPTVGESFLDAYETTGEALHLNAARDVAYALVKGQFRTGGWWYHIELDPERRQNYGYRDVPKRRKQEQKTTLDDDVTQSATRFLIRIDEALQFRDEKIHEAAIYALDSMIRAQYPNGGWYQWWDRYPDPPAADEFPVKRASYPETWSRTWLNDWTGRYFINDNVMSNMILTMLDAYEAYGGERYLSSALKAGDFLLLAQMPDPQPAWAQQYDVNMHPVWDRKFEPPAITGLESQGVMDALMLLCRKTGKDKYLKPIPRAIAYFKKSQLASGKLARFYELKTNKPLYFDRKYQLTYISDKMPTHYRFIVDSRLDGIQGEYQRLAKAEWKESEEPEQQKLTPELIAAAQRVIGSMDERGAWVEPGIIRSHGKIEPSGGIISCRTFSENIGILCRFIAAAKLASPN